MQSEQLPKFSLFNAIVSDMNSKLLKLIRQSLKELTFDFELHSLRIASDAFFKPV